MVICCDRQPTKLFDLMDDFVVPQNHRKILLHFNGLSWKTRFKPNAVHFTVRGEPVEPPATYPEPFDKLRANGIFLNEQYWVQATV